LYSSPNIKDGQIKEDEMGWTCSMNGEIRNEYNILVGVLEGKRQLGKPRRRCDDIKMNLRDVGLESVTWIHLAEDGDRWRAVVITIMNLRVL
jgi:hypothetical protein